MGESGSFVAKVLGNCSRPLRTGDLPRDVPLLVSQIPEGALMESKIIGRHLRIVWTDAERPCLAWDMNFIQFIRLC